MYTIEVMVEVTMPAVVPVQAIDHTSLRRQSQEPGNRNPATGAGFPYQSKYCYSNGIISSATMLMILIKGFTAGPAVSLYGSPTVSPVTAALCASEPLPP